MPVPGERRKNSIIEIQAFVAELHAMLKAGRTAARP